MAIQSRNALGGESCGQGRHDYLNKYEWQLSSVRRSILRIDFRLKRALWTLTIATASVSKRLLDVLLSCYLITLFSPLWLAGHFCLRLSGHRSFQSLAHVDRNGKAFPLYQFRIFSDQGDVTGSGQFSPIRAAAWLTCCSLYRLPILLNILKGDMSFVGPSPICFQEGKSSAEYVRRGVRPGLTNPHILRKAANIAHDSRDAADREYIHLQSMKGDVGILTRSLPMLLMGHKHTEPAPEINILDITIHNHTMSEAVDRVIELAGGKHCSQLAFVNPDCLNIACEHVEYKALLQRLGMVLADGIGIHIACKMLREAMADNVNGTDLFPRLCKAGEEAGASMYFLGGRPGVAEAMAKNVQEQFPGLPIAGYHHGYLTDAEEASVIQEISTSGAQILLVAFGAPRQELWIDAHKHELGVGIAMGVGGLFDFMSGRVNRAPLWMREIGLEWVFRLLQEPGRLWRRYVIGNPLFLWRVRRWRKSS